MKTLWISSPRVCSHNPGKFYILREILFRNKILFLSSRKQIGITFSNPVSSMQQNKRRNKPVFASSATKETLPDEQTQIQDTSKTVHVKFQLQRKCLFGEQFLLLGDDTMFGSWDPLSAVPLDWSEGDIWTVELDVPIEKVITYKFILKNITGDIFWQPGPDRVLKTWETMKTISVFEDWENNELQMTLEEELVPKKNEQFIVDSDMETVAENKIGAKNSMLMKEPKMNHANEEQNPVHVSNDEVSYVGVPVLVPGLAPIATIDTENTSLSESNYHMTDNSSSQAENLKERSGPEKFEIESPQSKDSTEMMMHIQEKEHDNKQEIKYDHTDEKEDYLKQIETVFENDIRWGLTTLRKLLNNFGFSIPKDWFL